MINLETCNPQWKDGFMYPFTQQRTVFATLVKNIDNRLIIALYGLRRTGKTVLLKQVMNALVNLGVPRTDILFFSFDEEQPRLKELFNAAEKLGQKPKYVFLDEIQKLQNWQNQIKFYWLIKFGLLQ